ncbi:MAG: helix-turn-helix domain-containing protein [Mariprofundus sp.]
MDSITLSDQAIEKEIGQRMKALRLRKNISQQALATAACTHRNVIGALENGKGSTLSTLIAVLRELDALNELDAFIPDVEVSPIEMLKSQGKKRQRASGGKQDKDAGDSEW